jgi:hypothetical protein
MEFESNNDSNEETSSVNNEDTAAVVGGGVSKGRNSGGSTRKANGASDNAVGNAGENPFLAKVFDTLTNFSFGKELYGDEHLMRSLKDSLPQMQAALQIRQENDISNAIALDICYRSVGEKKMKPNDHRRLCFEAALVLLHYPTILQRDDGELMNSVQELFVKYPEFLATGANAVDAKEAENLLKFRNFMYVAVQLISPHNHKNHLLELVTRLTEGRNVKYITGSGETLATSRRVKIYRKEGNVIATPKNVKTKAEREAQRSAGAKRGAADDDEDDDDDDDDDDYESSKKKKSSSAKNSARNPPKKRHNHRQLDDNVMPPPAAAAQPALSMSTLLPVKAPECFRTLADITSASQLGFFAKTGNVQSNNNFDKGYKTLNLGKTHIEFHVGLDSDANGKLPSPGVSFQVSDDAEFRCDRQTSLETVGTLEHTFFRQPLVDAPELFGYGQFQRGISATSFGDYNMDDDTDVPQPDKDAVNGLVMLRTQSS